jgi:Fe-S cluster biogenesis protein NfuA
MHSLDARQRCSSLLRCLLALPISSLYHGADGQRVISLRFKGACFCKVSLFGYLFIKTYLNTVVNQLKNIYKVVVAFH